MKTILPNSSPPAIAANPSRASLSGSVDGDQRPHVAVGAEAREPLQLVARAHGRADHRELEEEDPGELGRRPVAAGRARHHQRAAGLEGLHGVAPGRRAHGLHHHVHALGQARARLERLVGTQLDRLGALVLRAAGHPHARAGRAADRDQGAGHAAARALDQDRLPGGHAPAREQHAVRGEPGGGKAGRLLERQLRRLRHQVAPWHGHPLGERPRVLLRQERSLGVEGLVVAPVGIRDHRVDDHLVAVGIHAGGVTARAPSAGGPRPDPPRAATRGRGG